MSANSEAEDRLANLTNFEILYFCTKAFKNYILVYDVIKPFK